MSLRRAVYTADLHREHILGNKTHGRRLNVRFTALRVWKY